MVIAPIFMLLIQQGVIGLTKYILLRKRFDLCIITNNYDGKYNNLYCCILNLHRNAINFNM